MTNLETIKREAIAEFEKRSKEIGDFISGCYECGETINRNNINEWLSTTIDKVADAGYEEGHKDGQSSSVADLTFLMDEDEKAAAQIFMDAGKRAAIKEVVERLDKLEKLVEQHYLKHINKPMEGATPTIQHKMKCPKLYGKECLCGAEPAPQVESGPDEKPDLK